MKKKRVKKVLSFAERVRQLVCSRDETSVEDVISALGRHIADAKAAVYGRRELKSNNSMIRRGKRHGMVRETLPLAQLLYRGRRGYTANVLVDLARRGKLIRLRRGVYGPPVPKLYQPADAG